MVPHHTTPPSAEDIASLAETALCALPEELRISVRNLAIAVEEVPDEETLEEMGLAYDRRDVGGPFGHAAARIKDRPEQQQLRAREAVDDLDVALRHVGHEHRLGRSDQKRGEQGKGAGADHDGCTV